MIFALLIKKLKLYFANKSMNHNNKPDWVSDDDLLNLYEFIVKTNISEGYVVFEKALKKEVDGYMKIYNNKAEFLKIVEDTKSHKEFYYGVIDSKMINFYSLG
jgi:hypothetical protein